MFERMKQNELWMKVFAASMSTSLIIMLSFFIRDYINKKRGRDVYYENPKILDVIIEFSLIFFSSFVAYTTVYMLIGLEL